MPENWKPANDYTEAEQEDNEFRAEMEMFSNVPYYTTGVTDHATAAWMDEYKGINSEICELCGCSPCKCCC